MNNAEELFTYTCSLCGHPNRWTYDQITQQGVIELTLNPDAKYESYSLQCQKPSFPQCQQRRSVKVLVK